MSAQHATVIGPRSSTRGDVDPNSRLIVLAVGHRVDEVAATWLLDWIRADDRVHVVNVVDPAPLPPGWTPADDGRHAGDEVVEQTRLLLGDRAARAVPGSVLAGDPVRVLRLIASVADVVVLGADARGGTLTRRVAAAARCAVVVVPAHPGWRRDASAPVTAVLSPGEEVRVLQTAIAEASRLRAPLQTIRVRGVGNEHLGVVRAAAGSRLVVAPRRSLGTIEVTDAWDLCPVLVLPASEHDEGARS